MRMARAALNWSQGDLAEMIGVSDMTIKRMELKGFEDIRLENLIAVRKAFEDAGVTFTKQGCVCPPK